MVVDQNKQNTTTNIIKNYTMNNELIITSDEIANIFPKTIEQNKLKELAKNLTHSLTTYAKPSLEEKKKKFENREQLKRTRKAILTAITQLEKLEENYEFGPGYEKIIDAFKLNGKMLKNAIPERIPANFRKQLLEHLYCYPLRTNQN